MPIPEELRKVTEAIKDEIREHYLGVDQSPWIVGFSGGKDSTLLLQLVIEAIQAVPPGKRTRKLYIMSNDTLVESPIFYQYIASVLHQIKTSVEGMNLNSTVIRTVPDNDGTFWFNLLGKGYPAPNRTFRWCTRLLKIRPTGKFIQGVIDDYKKAILLLGVRKDESIARSQVITKYESEAIDNLSPHNNIPNCFIYAPIKNLTNAEAWTILENSRPPWGGNHNALCTVYRDASAGDQAFIEPAEDDAPKNTARFGCWLCTVIDKDKSLQATIGNGHPELTPLLEYRNKLKAFSSDYPEYREKTRRDGRHGLGPLTLKAREILLNDLLDLSQKTGLTFVSESEIKAIKEQWTLDRLAKQRRTLLQALGENK